MTTLTKTIRINAPSGKIFQRITDQERLSEWLLFVDKTEYPLARRRGVTTLLKHEGNLLGRKISWESMVNQWEENKRIGWISKTGYPQKILLKYHIELSPVENETEVKMIVDYMLSTPFIGNVLDRWFYAKRMDRLLEKSLENLKAILESQPD